MSLLLWSALRFQPAWTTFGSALTVLFLTYLDRAGPGRFRAAEVHAGHRAAARFMSLFSIIPLVLVARSPSSAWRPARWCGAR
jgi:integral membrane sensor domain MASE1